MKAELRSWIGQSVVDKLITGGLLLGSPLAGWMARAVDSEGASQVLLIVSVVGAFALALMLYMNRRLAGMRASIDRHEDLFAVAGYIVQHRINEQPRTGLDRRVQFSDPKDREAAVLATIESHRNELLHLIREANPAMSTEHIADLLDVYYGSPSTGGSSHGN